MTYYDKESNELFTGKASWMQDIIIKSLKDLLFQYKNGLLMVSQKYGIQMEI